MNVRSDQVCSCRLLILRRRSRTHTAILIARMAVATASVAASREWQDDRGRASARDVESVRVVFVILDDATVSDGLFGHTMQTPPPPFCAICLVNPLSGAADSGLNRSAVGAYSQDGPNSSPETNRP